MCFVRFGIHTHGGPSQLGRFHAQRPRPVFPATPPFPPQLRTEGDGSSGVSRQQQQARAAVQTEANSAERKRVQRHKQRLILPSERTLPQPTDAHVVACMRPAADQRRVRAAWAHLHCPGALPQDRKSCLRVAISTAARPRRARRAPWPLPPGTPGRARTKLCCTPGRRPAAHPRPARPCFRPAAKFPREPKRAIRF